MPINLEVAGVEYTNFTRASATLALDTLANDFSFEAVMPSGEVLPFKGGEECTVIVDGEQVLSGYIEEIEGSYSSDSHIITVSGRDKTCDLIDSSIDVLNDIRSPITLKQLIAQVVENVGMSIAIVDDASPEPFNKAEDVVVPQPGDNAFEFIEEYAQKRQVLLTSNSDGDIVITNSSTAFGGGRLQNSVGAMNNNILSASWVYSTVDLFSKYIQKAQLDPVALDFGGATSDDGVVSQLGEETDADIRTGRQLVTVSDKGFSQAQLSTRAQWSKKIRRVRSTVYSCTSQGFKNSSGVVWAVNTLASIFDEFANIDRSLLLNSVTFTTDENGDISTLGFVEANAYEIQLAEPKPVGTNQDAFKL
jgi:prophage tail gpP-like protein